MKTLDEKELIKFARSFIGIPYRWGGENRDGIDCSGLVQLILQHVKMDPPGDQTAHSLYLHFRAAGFKVDPSPCALVFFGRPEKIVHVGFCIDSETMVDAAGGGRNVQTLEDAKKHNAFVRESKLARRRDLVACYRPNYEGITIGEK